MSKTRRRSITVGKTKITKAPWEEERHIYDIKTGSNIQWSDDFWGVIIQLIVFVSIFIYVVTG